MFLLNDSKYLKHIGNADNHIFYIDGIVECPGALCWLRDMCKQPTLFISINLKTIDYIQTIGNRLLDEYPHIKQVVFDHSGDPMHNRDLSVNLNTWVKSKGIRGILASSEWTKKLHSDLIEILHLNMLVVVRQPPPLTLDLSPKKYRYSCLNRNPQWHRLLFYTLLKKQNLLDHFVYTFYDHCPYNNIKITPLYYKTKELFGNYYSDCMENITDFPLSWDNDIPGGNDFGIRHNAYLDAECNIVTETTVEVEFTSEKIWKPIMSGQCFHVVGSTGTNSWLRSRGFATFDQNYDNTVNNIERLEQVVKQLDGNSMWTPENLDKISHNYHLFYSREVENTILDPLVAIFDQ